MPQDRRLAVRPNSAHDSCVKGCLWQLHCYSQVHSLSLAWQADTVRLQFKVYGGPEHVSVPESPRGIQAGSTHDITAAGSSNGQWAP